MKSLVKYDAGMNIDGSVGSSRAGQGRGKVNRACGTVRSVGRTEERLSGRSDKKMRSMIVILGEPPFPPLHLNVHLAVLALQGGPLC